MNRMQGTCRRGIVAVLLGGTITACGAPQTPGPVAEQGTAGVPSPTVAATVDARPSAANKPTATPVIVDAQPSQDEPTARPTIVDAQPTQPLLGFSPKAGAPGTVISAWGTGYAPGARIAVRLGRPRPIGEVLASATADDWGRWSAKVTLPERWPSGEAIPTGELRLVAMDAVNRPLASAPLTFTAAQASPTPSPVIRDAQPELPEDAPDAVRLFLRAAQADRSGRLAAFYTDGSLRLAMLAGRTDVAGVLHEQSPFRSFTVDKATGGDDGHTYVQATLAYGDGTGPLARIFTVSKTDAGWRVLNIVDAPR